MCSKKRWLNSLEFRWHSRVLPLQRLTSQRLVLPGDNLHYLGRKTKEKTLPLLYTSCKTEQLISKSCSISWWGAEDNKQLNYFEEELGKRVTACIIWESYVSKEESRYISAIMASQSEYSNTVCSCKKITMDRVITGTT